MTTIAALALFLLSPAAEVSGSITLSNGRPARNATVWLEGAEKSKPLSRAVVDQRDRTFIPHISIVTVGTEIQFPNNDTVFHNVFAAFDAKKFDLGLYPRGKTKTQRFDKPGLVALMCSIHSEMSAFVMVVDTPYYAVADGSGRYAISGVNAGEYVVRAWHETGQIYSGRHRLASSERIDLALKRK